jgi:hypothetical protein
VQQFELDENWEKVQSPDTLLKKKHKVLSRLTASTIFICIICVCDCVMYVVLYVADLHLSWNVHSRQLRLHESHRRTRQRHQDGRLLHVPRCGRSSGGQSVGRLGPAWL